MIFTFLGSLLGDKNKDRKDVQNKPLNRSSQSVGIFPLGH